jgi:cysteine synthase A
MAQAVISRAEEDGRLSPGDSVVEYTGGSTGASLALVCAAKGYRLQIVSSDAFSQEKLDHMAALGAELTLVRSERGLTTKKLILDMIETARRFSEEPGTYWTDQLRNQDSIAGVRQHLCGRRHGAEAQQTGHQDSRGQTRGIVRVAGT